MKYFLIYSILMALGTDPLFTIGLEYGFYDTINTVIIVLLTIIGLVYCYKVNKSTDDKDFILRFVTLGLPIVVRLIALAIVVGIVIGLIDAIFIDSTYIEESETYKTTIVDVSITSVLIIAYYYYFARKLKLFAKS